MNGRPNLNPPTADDLQMRIAELRAYADVLARVRGAKVKSIVATGLAVLAWATLARELTSARNAKRELANLRKLQRSGAV